MLISEMVAPLRFGEDVRASLHAYADPVPGATLALEGPRADELGRRVEPR